MARYWYAYTGALGGENIIGNYILSNFSVSYCSGGTNLCMIYAPAGGAVPSYISQNIRNYIVAAKSVGTYYPNGLNQRPYVYSRN